MKIDFNDMMDYVRCPMIFLLKNVHGLNDSALKIEFEQAMKTAIFHFYFNVMENKILKADDLKNKWETLWFKEVSMPDVLYGEQDQYVKMGYDGLGMLINFHRLNWQTPGRPLAINYDFEVPIGEHILTGTLDLVKESMKDRTKFIEIVHFSTGNYAPDEFELRTNLYTTLQSYAFRKEFDTKEQALTYYSLKTNTGYSTTRSQDQYKRLENFTNIVCTSIQSNFYFPRPSFLCRGCKLKEYCAQWGVK